MKFKIGDRVRVNEKRMLETMKYSYPVYSGIVTDAQIDTFRVTNGIKHSIWHESSLEYDHDIRLGHNEDGEEFIYYGKPETN